MRRKDMTYVSVCPKCNYTSAGSSPYASFSCPKCHARMINTQMRPEKWDSLTISEQAAILEIDPTKFEMTDRLSSIVEAEHQLAENDYKSVLAYESFIMTTAPTIETRIIDRYIGIIHSETVLGLGLTANFGSGISDFLGIEDSTLAKKLHDAKKTALAQLKKQCIEVGANACISVDFDLMTLSGSIIVASASGTAVVLADAEKEND